MQTTASRAITVIGRNMGSSFGSDKVSVAGSAASMSVWVSVSSISARLSAGCAPANTIRLSVDYLSSSATQRTVVISFSAPRLSGISLSNSPRTASLIATLYGTQFGIYTPSLGARAMMSSSSFSRWVSDSSLFSKTANALARSAFSVVSVAFQISSVSAAVSYDVPLVNYSQSIFLHMMAVASTGSTIVSVQVSSAALSDSSLATRFVSSTVEATSCISDSTCIAKFTAITRNNINIVQASVGLYATASEFFLQSFIYLVQQRLTVVPTGIQSITIAGISFGLAQYSSAARARMSACQSSLWVSDSSIRCRGVAGADVLVGGFVSVAKVASSSVSSVFSYSVHAVVSALVPGSGGGSSSGAIAASGGLLVAVLGGGYSSVGLSQIVRLRGSSCIMSAWLSDSGLQCRSAWGKDLSSYSRQVVVSVMRRWSLMTNAISYASVVPSVASVDRVPTTGGRVVSMSGQHIGGFGVSAGLQLQGTAFETSRWVSSTCLTSRSPSICILRSTSIDLVVSASNFAASAFASLLLSDYATSMIYPLSNAARSGSISLSIFGRGFGVSGDSPRSYLGVTECRTFWRSDSSFQLKSPLTSIPFAGIFLESKTYSALSKFNLFFSRVSLVDNMFLNSNSFGHSSAYWPQLFCNLTGAINANAYSQVYALARSVPIYWNSSQQDQQKLVNISASLLNPLNNISILNLAAGHAVVRVSSVISEMAYDEKNVKFCGLNFLAVQAALTEFTQAFSDAGGSFFIANTQKMCASTPLQQTQVSYQILMCMQPAFTPAFFSSLLTVASFYSIFNVPAADKYLGSNFTDFQVSTCIFLHVQ
jgi:hypothetical protein